MKVISVLLVSLAMANATSVVMAQHDHGNTKDARHFTGVNERGDMAMGFDHSKTTHHFRLYRNGGAIGVEAKDAKDARNRVAIRSHLNAIRTMFAQGNFELPMFIHATTPPGINTMKRLRKSILYTYVDTPHGAQVRLSTHDVHALSAIHEFLRFQIKDHQTGDSLALQK
jgi:hypothetical protein